MDIEPGDEDYALCNLSPADADENGIIDRKYKDGDTYEEKFTCLTMLLALARDPNSWGLKRVSGTACVAVPYKLRYDPFGQHTPYDTGKEADHNVVDLERIAHIIID